MSATLQLLTTCVALGLSLSASFALAGPFSSVLPAVAGMTIVGQQPKAADRQEADDLLKRARQAIKAGDLELAEFYVGRAEKLKVTYDRLFQPFVDTPEKVRRDLDKAKRTGKSATRPPSSRFPLPRIGGSSGDVSGNQTDTFSSAATDELVGTLTDESMARARRYLENGRAALARGETTAAIGWYHSALGVGARFVPGEYSPDDLAAELRGAGVDPTRLAHPAPGNATPGPLTPADAMRLQEPIPAILANTPSSPVAAGTGQMIANPYAVSGNGAEQQLVDGQQVDFGQARRSRRDEALKLLSQAQVAIDRGDLDRAEQLARMAQDMNVPEEQYREGDVRPWILLMDISRRRTEQSGGSAGRGASFTVSDSPAFGQVPPGVGQDIQQSLFDPRRDSSRNMRTSAQGTVLAQFPQSTVAAESGGAELFRRGDAALREGDLDAARRFFIDAWGRKEELDPGTRQRLQDHLQVMGYEGAAPGDGPADVGARPELSETQQQQVRKLFGDVTRELAAASRRRQTNPKGTWDRLQQLRSSISEYDVDSATRQQLTARVDRGIQDLERYIEQNRAKIELDERNHQVLADIERRREHTTQVQQKLAEFVEQFNTLMQQQRFPEAVVIAKQAQELDPRNPVVQNMVWKGQFARQFASNMARQFDGQTGGLAALDSAADSAIPFDDRISLEFPEVRFWNDLKNRRGRLLQDEGSRFGQAELEIQRALKTQVDVNFENQPLSEVMNALGRMAGVNIHLDAEGLAAEGVTSDSSVTITLRKPISLRSALNLILQQKRLGYIIQDEVLRVTSEQARHGDVYQHVYDVADLVIPIPNFVPSYHVGLPGALREAHNSQASGLVGGVVHEAPLTVMADNAAPPTGNEKSSVLAQMSAAGLLPATGRPQPTGFGPGGLGGGPQADFDSLIELITTTIEPDSWDDVGGPGSVAEFEGTLSLVISQTQEIHEKIVDLLRQLRRLQDLQVTIEVRFITLSDNFFERIGVDFDFDIKDNTGLNGNDVIDHNGPSVTIGLGPDGQPTADLDIQFNQGSFGTTIPQFGGFDAGSAANFGFAILSDIEAFFVIQAAQGDSRSNVMQAPKVTLYNGQLASVSDQSQRPFVTSVIPVVGDFAAAQQPVITVLSEGTSLSVQAVVSSDRRFVRLTLAPFFSKIGNVDTFTFTGSTSSDTGTAAVDPSDDTRTVRDNAMNFTEGTTVQLPTFAFTTVNTTVNVPDGGTVLLGGIKRLSEGRSERGVPLLSKMPYVNRLFKNVGIGRETESLMMMVTPRIIILEEEEEKLGVPLPPGT